MVLSDTTVLANRKPVEAPVVLVLYNRPAHVRQVFAAIAAARPRRLFLVADGPKDHADAEKCQAARAEVGRIDWPCEVHRNYAEANLGIHRRLPTGLDWVFESADRAIILEDDCIPSLSFFPFCEQLLERFQNDERVMEIAGGNYQMGRRRTAYSYYFSRYWGVWGWATWRRAWRHFDGEMRDWPRLRDAGFLDSVLPRAVERDYWIRCFDALVRGEVTTWDWQWLFTLWAQHGLSVVPEVNLISNIGYGEEATNLRAPTGPDANLPRHEMGELEHPPWVFPNTAADRFLFDVVLPGSKLRLLPSALRGAIWWSWRTLRQGARWVQRRRGRLV